MHLVESITSVSFEPVGILPGPVVLVATAENRDDGWTGQLLVPVKGMPDDGIQTFRFEATPPANPSQGLTTVMKKLTARRLLVRPFADYWGRGKPLKGVRVVGQRSWKGIAFGAKSVSPDDPHGSPTEEEIGGEIEDTRLFVGDDNIYPLGPTGDLPPIGPEVRLGTQADLQNAVVGRQLRIYFSGFPTDTGFMPDRVTLEVDQNTNRVVSAFYG